MKFDRKFKKEYHHDDQQQKKERAQARKFKSSLFDGRRVDAQKEKRERRLYGLSV